MNFKLTYSTMFDPPAELHAAFDQAMARCRSTLGANHDLYIGGENVGAVPRAALPNPARRSEVLGYFPRAQTAHAEQAMTAAHAAFPAWRALPWRERVTLLRRVAGNIAARVYDIAAAVSLEVGKNRMEALGEVQETADFFSHYADDFERNHGFDVPLPNDPLSGFVSRNRSVLKPYGAWVVITPFNFPFALAGGPVAAALVTGNTVVLKGASDTPWSGRLLADAIAAAGVPPGVFNYLSGASGEIGQALVAHPSCAGITFTGSQDVGMAILRQRVAGAYPRPCIAEMGGKNAAIVTAHADLDRAAQGIVRSAFGMSGQKCSAVSRLYVDAAVAEELIARLRERIAAIAIGDPALQANWLGPVTNAAAFANYQRHVAALASYGSRIIAGGHVWSEGPLAAGLFVAPTLAEAPLAHPLWNQEMFLPILMLARVRDRDEAMALANASPFGLTAGVYGNAADVAWFQEHIEAGVTYANRPQGATTGAWPGYQPFGGWKGSGNTGKAIASFYYLPLYLREQSQTVVE